MLLFYTASLSERMSKNIKRKHDRNRIAAAEAVKEKWVSSSSSTSAKAARKKVSHPSF